MAVRASSSQDLWKIHDYLSEQRQETDELFDYSTPCCRRFLGYSYEKAGCMNPTSKACVMTKSRQSRSGETSETDVLLIRGRHLRVHLSLTATAERR
jgi:hypothetical protein